MALVSDQGCDLVHVPDVVPVQELCSFGVVASVQPLAGLRIAPVGQFAIALDGVQTAPLQLIADRGLPGARPALDEIVANAH